MTDQKKTRRQKLEEFLASNPNDAFSRYGIALECIREGDLPAAESHFRTLLEANPDYVPGYQMFAQMLAQNNQGTRQSKLCLKASTLQFAKAISTRVRKWKLYLPNSADSNRESDE